MSLTGNIIGGIKTSEGAKKDLSNVDVAEYTWEALSLPSNKISSSTGYYSSVCYGNDRYVAVQQYGNKKAAYSTDCGKTWHVVAMPTTSTGWSSVCYGNGKFVAVSYNNKTAAYSSDGSSWSSSTLTDSLEWSSVCYGDGKFIAVAPNRIRYSTTGTSWLVASIPSGTQNLLSACYGNGIYVAIRTGNSSILTSNDGITWSQKSLSPAPSDGVWGAICYGDGVFVIVSKNTNNVAYSTDLETWNYTTVADMTGWKRICYFNKQFFIVESNTNMVAISSDGGASWDTSESHALPSTNSWYDICSGPDGCMAITSDTYAAAYLSKSSFLETMDSRYKVEIPESSKPKATLITLSSSSWDSSANTQSTTVDTVSADEASQMIIPMPAMASITVYNDAGIQLTAQGDKTVTFTADTIPTEDVQVWIVVENVEDVTPPSE